MMQIWTYLAWLVIPHDVNYSRRPVADSSGNIEPFIPICIVSEHRCEINRGKMIIYDNQFIIKDDGLLIVK